MKTHTIAINGFKISLIVSPICPACEKSSPKNDSLTKINGARNENKITITEK